MNDEMAAAPAAEAGAPAQPAADQPASDRQRLRFDTTGTKSTYCNVCNATSTREEVILNFGLNKTWDVAGADLEVEIAHRIILSPFAAKRLQQLLTRLMTEHEARYGQLGG